MKALHLVAAASLAAMSFTAQAIGNLATITVYDRAANRALPVHWHEGRAYVVGNAGNEYQVTVRNRAGEDVLAVVSVDGVNVMSGETAATRQSGYVLAGGERVDVRGWRKSTEEIAAFYFASLGDSYAARTGRPGNVGVIGVALFKRKVAVEPAPHSKYAPALPGSSAPPSPAMPYAESMDAQSAPRAKLYADPSAPLGTGHGRRETSRVTWTSFERASDEPAEVIAIHYDSYRNLVARGVLNPPPVARNPHPFPGFVPDPPSSWLF